MAFDFNDFIGNVADNFNLNSSGLADVATQILKPTVSRIVNRASSVGDNPPTVAPTQYVAQQSPKIPIIGVSLSPNQIKIAGAAVIGLGAAYILLRRRK